MIKRRYFMHAKKYIPDGCGSYRFHRFIVTRKSWLDQTDDVFEYALKKIKDNLSVIEGDVVEVTCFTRI